MAAVTATKTNSTTSGNERIRCWRVSGNDGDTLVTGLKGIRSVTTESNSGVTGVSYTGGTITFSSGSSFSNVDVRVAGF